MSIRAGQSSFHYLLAGAAALTCTAALAIGLTIWWLRSDAIRNASTDVGNLAVVLAEQTANSIQSIDLILTEIQDRAEISGARAPNNLDRVLGDEDAYRLLMERLSRLQQAEFIGLVDNNGRLVNTTRQWPSPEMDLSDRDYFQHCKSNNDKGIHIGNSEVDRINGTQVVFFSKRINGPNNTFLGVVVVGVRLTYFQHIYKSIESLRDQSFLLLHSDGTVIVRYPDHNSRVGEKMPTASPWHRLVSQGGGNFRSPGYFDGEARLVAVRSLRDYPLVVDVAVSETAALATWRIQAITFGAGALLVMLCVALLLKAQSKQFRRLATSEATVDAALNNMSQGLLMFDSSSRLVVCNQRYLEMYGLSPDIVRPGCTLREIVEHRAATGSFSADDVEQYIADILAAVGQKTVSSKITNLHDGRIIYILNRPIANDGWIATHEDVTEAKRQEASFRLLFKNNPVPMWVYDRESLRFLAVNETAVAHYGYSHEQFLAMTVRNIRPLEERERFDQAVRINGGVYNGEETWRHQKLDGTIIYIAIYSQALIYEGHAASLVAAIDLTERKRAEDDLHRTKNFFNTVIENVPQPIVVKSATSAVEEASEHRIVMINRAAETFFGISRDQMIGKNAHDVYSKDYADFVVRQDSEALRADHPIRVSDHAVEISNKDIRIVTSRKVAILDDDGKPEYLLSLLEDVTERKRAEQRIVHMAHYDTLTDLPNRATFNDTMDAALSRAEASGEQFAVLSIDLDRFKGANDTYGHLAGDALLREVARRQQAAAEGAFLARIGGDEFALLVADGAQPAAAAALAERLLAAFVDDFEVEGHRLKLSASIGVAIYPTDGTDAKTLMTNADAALYRVKAEMCGTALFFEAEMSARLRERRALQEDLRSAIDRGELLLHYQPQKKMSGETIGFEALARWQCPKRGMVLPSTFIPIAEESSFIIPIGEWVLREACHEATSWPQPLTIAVNVSPMQFRHGDLPRLVHSILLETGLAPGRLELEITESVMINDFSRAVSILRRLKSLGVRIAMDDFGTGYSSLSYLQSFKFDKIKIDRIFICDLESNHHSKAIVRAVIGLGRSLDLPILAEGVETEAQHALLVQEGCDEVQGYLTGRPLPIADYAKLVGRQAVAQQNYAVAG
jgi:diguanylate cyclase (GGDEF)-like protein/PAS domain S-box-containing protein